MCYHCLCTYLIATHSVRHVKQLSLVSPCSLFGSSSSSHLCFSTANRQVQQGEACCQATAQNVWLKLWFPIYHLRLMWLLSSDALQSSWDGLMHSSSRLAKWIFSVKWNIWLTWSRVTSSSTNLTSSYTSRMSFSIVGKTCIHLTWIILAYFRGLCLLQLHIWPSRPC